MTDTIAAVRISRVFSAPRQQVFDAWVKPELRKQWWMASPEMSCAFAEIDARPGGRYRLGMTAPDGSETYVTVGEFVDVVEREKLVFTWSWEHAPNSGGNDTLVTVEFSEVAGGTELTLTHERFKDQQAHDEHTQGWNGCLEQLAGALV